ncbi:autotransporter-associated beta strand repeat-containing protein, partial [Polynucleobacter sp. Fuers-14]|uniref:autotransporter-associated beta strand repeat-containing protein n=1 Tax=Polynucleobacter sp. Fuers-14 TaxID=1758364 RepID=UPI0021085936
MCKGIALLARTQAVKKSLQNTVKSPTRKIAKFFSSLEMFSSVVAVQNITQNTICIFDALILLVQSFQDRVLKKKFARVTLSSNFKLQSISKIKPKAILSFFVLIAFQCEYVVAQPLNALPTNGKVVAGSASISQTTNTMTINQSTQRAVINWDSFNIGKNASVNINTPGANSATLNRVTGTSASQIDGALKSNGQIVLVNQNGVVFGRGAQVDAAAVTASTMNIADKDFMDGKSTYNGNGTGKIINKGSIQANEPDGFIALLAPEVQNQGYVLARAGGSIAMAAGDQVTLNFQGNHSLVGVTVDKATLKALIVNKRVVETNGGLIVLAAGAANQLMSSVVKNTGKISASSMVNNGGVIELVANNVTQAGTVEANSSAANGKGGQVNLVANDIKITKKSSTTATGTAGGGQVNVGLAQTQASGGTQVNAQTPSANTAQQNQAVVASNAAQAANTKQMANTVTVKQGAVIDVSATQNGNAGSIAIWSQVKTTVAGTLKAIGGAINGNGGFIETSSKGIVNLAPKLVVDTSAAKGKSGLWFLDPIDLIIDASAANVISLALANNNVSIAVNGNVCPSLGGCTQAGSGNLTIASGANILKQGLTQTTLTLTSSGIFNLNADISGQNLNVIINSSIAYLNVGTTITATQVTVQAQTIYANGTINASNGTTLGAAIQLLAQAIYVSGGLNTSTSSNSNTSNTTNTSVTYNGNVIRKEDLPTFLTAQNNPNGNIASGLDVVYTSSAANDSSASAQTNTNQTNIIHLNAVNDLTIYSSAQILANGTNGGQITLSAQQLNAQSGSLIQANGNNGPGGVIAINGTDIRLAGAVAANGSNGGSFAVTANTITIDNAAVVQTNSQAGPGGTITLTSNQDIQINQAQISANGYSDGGSITIVSNAGNLNTQNTLIQTNGSNGRGGSIGIAAFDQTNLVNTTVEARGLNQGGIILIGNDAKNGTLPFSIYTSIDSQSVINAEASNINPATVGGYIETSGHTVSMLASINAGRGGIWLIDPVDLTIDSTFASAIVSGLASSNVVVSTTANTCSGVTCPAGSGSSGNIFINSSIATNTNNNLYIESSGAIVLSSGVNIWLNTSNNSSYTASTGTGSLFMGGVSVGSITSSNWNTSCTGCYANAVQGGAGGSNYSGINLGTSGAGSAAVNIQVGGDVVMAGQNATTSNGYAGITLYSGSKVYGRNVSFYGISSAGSGMQLGWGSTAAIDVRATGTLLMAGSSSYVDSGATGTSGLGVFVNGSILRAPTIQIIGLNTNASCVQNIACAGIGLGWYTTNGQTTNIYTSNLKLVSDAVVLGLSPVQVAFCDSGCGGGIGTSLGIDFSSYSASSAITFYYPGSGSSTTSVAAGNNYGNYLVLPTAPNFSSYRYSVGGAITVGANLSVNGPISITASTLYLGANLTTTNGSTGNILIQDTVSTDAGLTGSGAITLAGGAGLTINQLGNSTYGGAISGALSTFTKSGGGTLTLTGANTFTGGTTVLAGTLVGSSAAANAFGTGTVTLGNTSGSANASVLIGTTGLTYSNAIVLATGTTGTLTLGNTGSATSTTFSGGVTGSNNLTINENATSGTITFATGSINNTGTVTNIGAGTGATTISAVIGTNVTGVTENSSTSNLILSGPNTYTGGTTISAGTLKVGNATALGASSGAVSLTSGAVLDLNGTTMTNTNALTLNGAGVSNAGAIINSSATPATYAGAVTLGSNTTIGGTGAITFGSTVDSSSTVAYSLASATGASNALTFNGIVGGNQPLSSLSTSTGVTTLGGNVTTTGAAGQVYNGNVVLINPNIALSSSGYPISFAGNISTQIILQLLGSGSYIFNGTTSTLTSGVSQTLVGGNGSLLWTASSSTYTYTPATSSTAQILVVGGGGGGGLDGGGGGGAGGFVQTASNAFSLSGSTAYSVVVGAGGSGATGYGAAGGNWAGIAANNTGASGGNSCFGTSCSGSASATTLVALGGGGGGTKGYGGASGGSGGGTYSGASGGSAVSTVSGITATSGELGNSGGILIGYTGGGGGGSATAGASSGGNGTQSSITGSALYYAAGGGGGNWSTTAASGGSGIGGNGGSINTPNNNATIGGNGVANTGSGGGGGGNTVGNGSTGVNGSGATVQAGSGGNGGSGIVVVNSSSSLTINAGAGQITFAAGKTISNVSLALNSSYSTSNGNTIASSIGATNNSLTLTGGGLFTLSGTNSYSGGTTLSAGTLKLASATALGAASGAVSIASGAILDLNGQTLTNANPLTINGTGSGNGALINSSSTGATYIGLLSLGSSSQISGGNGTITLNNVGIITGSGFSLTLGGAQGGSISGIIATAAGSVTKQDAGTWTLSGANSYTGGTTVNAGTLRIASGGTAGASTGAVTITSATLDLQTALTIGSLSMSGTSPAITTSSGTSSLAVSGTATLANAITTSGIQTYGGAVTLGAGTTLTTTNSNVIFGSSIDGTSSGAQSLTIANGSGAIALGGNVGVAVSLSAINFSSGTATTILGGSVNTSGSQTYSGAMYVAASSPTLTSTSGPITITGAISTAAVVQFTGTSTGAYTLNGNSSTASTTAAIAGAFNITYAGGSFTVAPLVTQSGTQYLVVGGGGGGGNANCNCYNGGGGGGGGAVLTGSASLSLGTNYVVSIGAGGAGGANGVSSGSGSSGLTTAVSNISGGLSAAGGGAGSGVASPPASAFTAVGGQWFGYPGTAGNVNAGAGGYGGSNGCGSLCAYENGGAGYTSNITGSNYVYSSGGGGGSGYTVGVGSIAGTGGSGAGNGSNSGNGGAATNYGAGGGGAYYTGTGGAGAAGTVVLALPANALSINAGSGAVSIGSSSKLTSLTITSSSSSSAQSSGGVISGATNLIYSGSGTLTLAGTNTYTGTTTINGGTLRISADANLGTAPVSAATNLTINNGSTLLITGQSGAVVLAATRNIVLGSGGEYIQNNNTSYAVTINGAISGSSGLTIGSVANAGTVILGNASNSYVGDTTVTAGTLSISADGNLGNASGNIILGGGNLTLTGSTAFSSSRTLTVNSAATLTNNNSGSATFSGSLNGSANLTVTNGSNTVNGYFSTSAGAFVSNTTVAALLTSGMTGYLGGANASGSANMYIVSYTGSGSTAAAVVEFQYYDGSFTKYVTAQLAQSGSNVTIQMQTAGYINTSANSYLGQNLTSSTANYATLGLATSASGTGYGLASVSYFNSTTFSGSGIGNYNGNLTVNAGTVRAGSTTAFGTGKIYVTGSTNYGTFDLAGLTISNALYLNAGNGQLNASNTTYIGTMALTDSVGSGVASGAVTLQSNVMFGGPLNFTVSGAIGGAFNIQKTSGNTVQLSNAANTYSIGTLVLAGILQAGSGKAFGSGSITVSPYATLDLNGQTFTNTNTLTINGAGFGASSTTGALINSNSTPATYIGAVTLGSNASIGGPGAITLSGAITGSTYTLTLYGANLTATTNTNSVATLVLTGGQANFLDNTSLTVNASSLGGNTTIATNSNAQTITFAGNMSSAAGNSLTINALGGLIVNSNISVIVDGNLNVYANTNTSNYSANLNPGSTLQSTGGAINMNMISASHGVTLNDLSVKILASGNININSVTTGASGGIAFWVYNNSGSGGSVTSTNGNITIQGISTQTYTTWYDIYLRTPIIATNGSTTISAAGYYGGIYFDFNGSVSAKNNIDIIGYGGSTSGNGVEFSIAGTAITSNSGGLLRSTNGSITVSGYSASNVGIQSDTSSLNIVALAGNIVFQGSSLSTNTNNLYNTANAAIGTAVTNLTSAISGGPTNYSPSGFSSAVAGSAATGYWWGIVWYGNLYAVGNPYTVSATTAGTQGGGITMNGQEIYAYSAGASNSNASGVAIFGNPKFYAYGNISITGSADYNGVSNNGAGYGIIFWSGNPGVYIRSYSGSLTLNGYANGYQSNGFGGCGSGCYYAGAGIAIYDATSTFRAAGDVIMNGINAQGIGVYQGMVTTTAPNATSGVISDSGNVSINGLGNNSIWAGTYIRMPTFANGTLAGSGNITVTGAGAYGVFLDSYSAMSAAANISLIGYGTNTNYAAVYVAPNASSNTIATTNGNIVISGTASATSGSAYGVWSNASTSLSSSNGNIIFQGANLGAATSIANAIANSIYAAANPSAGASGYAGGTYWTYGISASNGYVSTSGNTNITGLITASGLLATGAGSYTFSNTSNAVTNLASSSNIGAITYTGGSLNIGTVNSVVGLSSTDAISLTATGTGVTLNQSITETGASKAIGITGGLSGAGGIITTTGDVITLSNTSSVTPTYSGSITGGGSLIYSGSGTGNPTQVLSGPSSFTGGTTISASILKVAANTTVASNAITAGPLGTGTVTVNGGKLDLNGQTIANNLSLYGCCTGQGVIVNSNSTAATESGNIVLMSDAAIGGTYNFTLSGTISGNKVLTKVGNNTITLSGPNTYGAVGVADTIVSAGTLAAGGNSTPSSSGTLTSGPFGLGSITIGSANTSNATVDLNGYSILNPFTLNGVGVGSNGALINSNTGSTANANGAITIASAAYAGGLGSITFGSSFTDSSNYGIAFINIPTVTAASIANNLTVASSGTGVLNLTSAGVLTVGGVNSINGISSSGNVTLKSTYTGGSSIQINQNVTLSGSGSQFLAQAAGTLGINTSTSGAVTITTQNGTVALASDSAGTGGGGVFGWGTTNINTNGGNLFLGGGTLTKDSNGIVTATGYAQGRTSGQSEGVRFVAESFNTAGGNISILGKSGTSSQGGAAGAWGFGVDQNAYINSGTGTIYISGIGQSTNAGDYTSGILFDFNAASYSQTITSANTTANAIQIIGSAATAANASWNSGIMFNNASNTVIAATGVGGGITIQGTRNIAGNVADIYFNGTNYILANSGSINILGTTASGRLYIAAQSAGVLNIGASSATAVTTALGSSALNVSSSSSNVKVQFDTWNWWTNGNGNNAGTAFDFYNSGTVTILPVTAASASSIATSWWNFATGNNLTGLTIGAASVSGTTMPSATYIQVNSPISINGPTVLTDGYVYTSTNVSTPGALTLNAVAGDVTFNNGVTVTGAGNGLMAKATGNILTVTGLTFQTNKGPITFWANSSNGTAGDIEINSSNTFNTNNGSTANNASGGGAITLAGGADNGSGAPAGYAIGIAALPTGGIAGGFNIGVIALSGLSMNSGGGNIIIQGQGANATSALSNEDGIAIFGGTINSGQGTIYISGKTAATVAGNGYAYGIHLNAAGDGTTTNIISSNTSANAITLIGDSSGSSTINSSGIMIYYSGSATTGAIGTVIAATNGGGVTLTGKGTTSTTGNTGGYGNGIDINNAQILSTSGAINLSGYGNASTYGISMGGRTLTNNVVTIGQAAVTVGGVSMAASSSNISLNADAIVVNAGASTNWAGSVASSGTLTIQSNSNSFSSALTWPVAGLTLSSNLSGLTIGKSTNNQNVTVGSATSIAGAINIYGAAVAINAALTSTGTNANGNITIAGSSGSQSGVITTGAGGVFQFNGATATSTFALNQSNSLGGLVVNNGIVSITADTSLSVAPGSVNAAWVTLKNGGTLLLNATTVTLNANRGITLGLGGGGLAANSGDTLTYNGIIADGSNGYALTINGNSQTGTVVLGGSNTYGGNTTVSSGTLAISNANALGAAVSAAFADGNYSANNYIIGQAPIGSATDLSLAQIRVGAVITGQGISGSTTITNIQKSTVNGWNNYTFTLADTSAQGAFGTNYTASQASTATVASGATLSISGGITVANPIALNGASLLFTSGNNALSGSVTLGGATTINAGTGTQTISGALTGGYGLTVNSSSGNTGKLILSGANTYGTSATTTTVSYGSLQYGNATATGMTSSTGAISVASGASLIFNLSAATNVSNTISGAGTLIQAGAGTTTISGPNTSFTGPVNINSGTLAIGGANALNGASGGLVSIANGATLDLAYAGTLNFSSISMASGSAITNSTSNSGLSVAGISTLAGPITTNGIQTYTGAVTLAGPTSITTTNSNVTISSAVNGSQTLSISDGSGNTIFNADIGLVTPLTSVAVTTSGAISIGGYVQTSGTQTYGSNVVLTGANVNLTTLGASSTGANITISGNIDGTTANTNNLYLASGVGSVSITGAVGQTTALNYLGLGGTGSYVASFSNTYSYTGASQTYVVPVGISTITYSVNGASGASSTGNGGLGGLISGTMSVTAGQNLYLFVGGAGSGTVGGWNGGANGIASSGGGGGGATSIQTINTLMSTAGNAVSSGVLVVAGGGGGWGSNQGNSAEYGGVGGGNGSGGSASCSSCGPGVGASQSAGGAGGTGWGGYPGVAGTFGRGGAGGTGVTNSGGGGGGYYGGGGGDAGGGGGGSGYVNATYATVTTSTAGGATRGNGSIVLSGGGDAFTAVAQTGSITIGGAIKVAGLHTANTTFNLSVGANATGNSTVGVTDGIKAKGTVTLGASGNARTLTVSSGALQIAYSSAVTLDMSVTTSSSIAAAGSITIGSSTNAAPVTIDNATTLTTSASNGPVYFYGTINGANNLTISSGTGAITLGGNVGLTTPVAAINLSGGAISVAQLKASNGIAITSTGSANSIAASGTINNTGSTGTGITISAVGNVSLAAVTNSGDSGIRITGGQGIAAGTTTGGTITALGTVTNTGGVVSISMAQPESSTGGSIATALGITSSNASTGSNISYNQSGGTFTTPSGYTSGNYINYRIVAGNTVVATLGSNYSTVYGTAYNSTAASNWLANNVTLVSGGGGSFGVTLDLNTILSSLRWSSAIGTSSTNANIVQSATVINNGSITSTLGNTVTISGSPTYTITPAALTITDAVSTTTYNKTTTYGTLVTNAGYVVSGLVTSIGGVATNDAVSSAAQTILSGGVLGQGSALNSSTAATAGSFNTTPSAASGTNLTNYAITYVGAVSTIAKASLTYSVSNTSTTYGTLGSLGAATLTGIISGDTVAGTVTAYNGASVVTLATNTAAGTYSMAVSALTGASAGNYQIASSGNTPGTLTINQKALTYSVTNTSANYGVLASLGSPTLTGIISGDTVTGAVSALSGGTPVTLSAATTAGTYTMSVTSLAGTSAANYQISSTGNTSGTLTINKVALTVTAANATKTYDGQAYTGGNGVTYSGFVNSETASALGGAVA